MKNILTKKQHRQPAARKSCPGMIRPILKLLTVNQISVLGTLSTSFMRRCEPFNLSRGPRSPATSRDMSRWQDPGQFFQRPDAVANLSRCGSPGELCSLWRSHKGFKAKMAGLQQWPCGRVWLAAVFCFLNPRGMPPGTYVRVLLLPHRYLVSEKQISSGLQIWLDFRSYPLVN